MLYKEFSFKFHNTTFAGYSWKPDTIKAVIILIHGMGEHTHRFADFVIPKLIENNIAVIGYDQFGHGKTEGKRGHNPGFTTILDTVSTVLNKSKEFFGDLPTFLYGHSMGGNVVLNYGLKRDTKVKGIIATSPFLKLAFQPPSIKLFIGRILQKIAPSLTMKNEINPHHISRIEEEVVKYQNDPLIHDQISPNYSIAFIESGNWAVENSQDLITPSLILHGTGDKITDYKASVTFVSKSLRSQIKLYKDAYHELHHDLCKEQCMQDILKWIEMQME